MKTKAFFIVFGLALGVASLAPLSAAGETLEIPGTGDAMVVMKAIAEAYGEAHPGDVVVVPPSIGSSGGIKAVGRDNAQVGRVGRQIKEVEKPYGLIYLPIAKYPVVFFVHQSVTVGDLSVEQINRIYAGTITNWREVGGADAKIRVVRREEGDSSLRNLRATLPGFKEIELTKRSKTTTTTQKTVETVSTTVGAIGFGPLLDAQAAKTKVLSIGGKAPTDKDYVSFGTLALIYKPQSKTGLAGRFIDFVASKAAATAVMSANAVPYE